MNKLDYEKMFWVLAVLEPAQEGLFRPVAMSLAGLRSDAMSDLDEAEKDSPGVGIRIQMSYRDALEFFPDMALITGEIDED